MSEFNFNNYISHLINLSIIGYDSIAFIESLFLLLGIFMLSESNITTNCMKYSVLNILHTFSCVGDTRFWLRPLMGIRKSIFTGLGLYEISYSPPLSIPVCSYSSSTGYPSQTSNSLTICFLLYTRYCCLLNELTMF